MEQTEVAREPLRIDIVGAGRSRNGLGPFLAKAFEREGASVAAVAGRDAARAEANAASLSALLGHPVRAFAGLDALCASGIDALVVASPAESHLAALRAAASAGVSCLCEKPIVLPAEVAAAMDPLAALARSGALVAENVQWPENLGVLEALHGPAPDGGPTRVVMGLSPIAAEPRAMAEDSLPHLLSLVWSVARLLPEERLRLRAATLDAAGPGRCDLTLALESPRRTVEASLRLSQCEEQPRPAWFSVDGRRVDRRIGPGYSISFAGGGNEVSVEDPLQKLVGKFCRDLQAPPSSLRDVRRAAAAFAVASRLEVYGEAIDRLFG